MNEEFKSALDDAGVATAVGIRRCLGNVSLYERYLFSFLSDENYKNMCSSYEDNDYELFLRSVHTLKSVAVNLGMMNLHTSGQLLVDCLRSGDYKQCAPLLEEVKRQYESVCEIIRKYQQ